MVMFTAYAWVGGATLGLILLTGLVYYCRKSFTYGRALSSIQVPEPSVWGGPPVPMTLCPPSPRQRRGRPGVIWQCNLSARNYS